MAGGDILPSNGHICFGPFRLISTERLLLRDNRPVSIGGRALDILIALTGRAGDVVSKRELIDFVWSGAIAEESNLRMHITALRKALSDGQDDARYIVNVPGRGYSFVAAIQRADAHPQHSSILPIRPDHPRTLPEPPHFLVGRGETIAAVSSLLLTRRFVSVVGPGGIGKTTIAVAVAHALRTEFVDDAVYFVDLGSLTDPADVPSTIASVLGCLVQGPDPYPFIITFLRDRRALIVLDNCEHLIEAIALLSEALFRNAPTLYLLATTREALRAEGEHVHLLTPLEGPAEDLPTADQALSSPAVQLFMEKAASSGHHAELSDSEAPIVANLCRRLDGIALAIELVASRVGAYGIEGTANLLEHGGELLLQGRRSVLPRHQTLQAMLDWSFALLSAFEQSVLARLSIFIGPFSLDAALFVAKQSDSDPRSPANAIASLLDKSLISLSGDGGPSHYRLLDTTRAYAAAKLAESGEAEIMAQRHARYFAEFLEGTYDERSLFDRRDVTTFTPHMSNVRKALVWSFSRAGDLSLGIDLAIRAAPLFLRLSQFSECERWCRRAMESMHFTQHGIRQELAIQKALAISSMYTLGNKSEVRAAIERGLELSTLLKDQHHQFDLLCGLHIFLSRRGDFDGASDVAEQTAAIAKASGETTKKAVSEFLLATSKHCTGDQASALRHSRLGLQFVSNVRLQDAVFFGYGDKAPGLVTLSRSLWLTGFPDQGCEVARQAIDAAEYYDHPVTYCRTVIHSIYVLLWSGAFAEASRLTDAVSERAERYSLLPYRAVCLALKGELAILDGHASVGIEAIQKALETMLREQHHVVRSPTFCALATGLRLSGRMNEAHETIERALAHAQDAGEALWAPDLLRTRGEVLQDLVPQISKEAEASLLASIEHAGRQSALSWELKAAIPLARMWSSQGRKEDARTILEGPFRRFKEGFGTRDVAAARQLLEGLG